MSTCAILMVKDEADIIEPMIQHLLLNVDEVHVADNGSVDGTREILKGLPVRLTDDRTVAYYQSRKMTAMARQAMERGHKFVIPCDADEVWYAPDGRRLADWLGGVAPDVQVVSAELYNHIPTKADDPQIEDPFARIEWRQRQHGAMGKVCARTRPDLIIHAGNHDVSTSGTGLRVPGLVIRHFSWRSESQYLRKIRNGQAAYKATSLPGDIGLHWRMFETHTDEQIIDHYRMWFCSPNPYKDETLIFDPAPVWR